MQSNLTHLPSKTIVDSAFPSISQTPPRNKQHSLPANRSIRSTNRIPPINLVDIRRLRRQDEFVSNDVTELLQELIKMHGRGRRRDGLIVIVVKIKAEETGERSGADAGVVAGDN